MRTGYRFENKKGQVYSRIVKFQGFYEQWLRDWDVGGTYTDTIQCEKCKGTKLRPQYLAVSLFDYNIHEMSEFPLSKLYDILKMQTFNDIKLEFVKNSFKIILRRLKFLIRTGLGYINLNRIAESLSAGEAQRVRLAGLIESNLTSLTILLDEPSRGLHPSELETFLDVLLELRDNGNTVIIIEHDLLFIEQADYIIDMGPGAGVNGGEIVAIGPPHKLKEAESITAKWLNGRRKFLFEKIHRQPKSWLKIYGAREHNLKGDLIKIPHGLLVGICGISGSGKSTLLIDTLGRALVPVTHTTSVSREPIDPGEYDQIEGQLSQTFIIDQSKAKLRSPLYFLGLGR